MKIFALIFLALFVNQLPADDANNALSKLVKYLKEGNHKEILLEFTHEQVQQMMIKKHGGFDQWLYWCRENKTFDKLKNQYTKDLSSKVEKFNLKENGQSILIVLWHYKDKDIDKEDDEATIGASLINIKDSWVLPVQPMSRIRYKSLLKKTKKNGSN